MVVELSNILAAKDDETPLMKIIFFAIFALIWVVGAIAKAASAKKEQARREEMRRELEDSRKNAPDWGEIASRPTGSMPPLPPMPPRTPSHAPTRAPSRAPTRSQTSTPPRMQSPHPYNPSTPPPQRKTNQYNPSTPPPQRAPNQYNPSTPPPSRLPQMNMPSKRPPPVPIAQRNAKQKKPKKPRQEQVFAQQAVQSTASARSATPVPVAARRPMQRADAAQLRGWLSPQTLREQFILTEILQGPIALRRRENF